MKIEPGVGKGLNVRQKSFNKRMEFILKKIALRTKYDPKTHEKAHIMGISKYYYTFSLSTF